MAVRRGRGLLALLVLAALAAAAVWLVVHQRATIEAACTGTVGSSTYTIDPEQARNATTIAVEAGRQGLPPHAVSVGLAAALQESKLRNLSFGDRDSLGLFQQRPSQGWGSPAQLQDPAYAARAFYRGLRKVAGWQSMPIFQAAQRVQRSAAPEAYAAWDSESRVLAQGLTGEAPGGFSCRYPSVPRAKSATDDELRSAVTAALGSGSLSAASAPRGWLVASWLVSRAPRYSVARVSFDGWTWTPRAKGWVRDAQARGAGVTYALRAAS